MGFPPARRLMCSLRASTVLGRASGYGCLTITAMGEIRFWRNPAGPAGANINININIGMCDFIV